jgi:hypothetical protein
MRFDITGLAVSDLDRLPDRLSVIETLTPEAAVRTRGLSPSAPAQS